MSRQIKFTIGDGQRGYKTVEVVMRGDKVTSKILRGGLLNVDKKNPRVAEISDSRLAELEALDIFSWSENYSSTSYGVQWQLTFTEGKKIHHTGGNNACPENFEQFLDWLDALFPELEFVNRKRLERLTIDYADERLTLDRNDKTLTLDKKNSTHVYDLGDNAKKFFDTCQKFLDGIETRDSDINFSTLAKFELTRHDKTVETFATRYNENFLPGLTKFLDTLQAVMADLTAEIFNAETAEVAPSQGKYIFCKVQFKGNYKPYTYRTDDETLAVGDIVDVPVGRQNDITQARISDIYYAEEFEAPYPIDRIKKIIGKHTGNAWDN